MAFLQTIIEDSRRLPELEADRQRQDREIVQLTKDLTFAQDLVKARDMTINDKVEANRKLAGMYNDLQRDHARCQAQVNTQAATIRTQAAEIQKLQEGNGQINFHTIEKQAAQIKKLQDDLSTASKERAHLAEAYQNQMAKLRNIGQMAAADAPAPPLVEVPF